jgi:hypothetical protein
MRYTKLAAQGKDYQILDKLAVLAGGIIKSNLSWIPPNPPHRFATALKAKERQKEEAIHIEDRERSVTEEIKMLKVALYVPGRNKER